MLGVYSAKKYKPLNIAKFWSKQAQKLITKVTQQYLNCDQNKKII